MKGYATLQITSTKTTINMSTEKLQITSIKKSTVANTKLSSACHCGRVGRRAVWLERAVARVCRETGARVAHNVRVADMDVDATLTAAA